MNGAGEGNRTLVSGLGSPRSTIEPHPQSCGRRGSYHFPLTDAISLLCLSSLPCFLSRTTSRPRGNAPARMPRASSCTSVLRALEADQSAHSGEIGESPGKRRALPGFLASGFAAWLREGRWTIPMRTASGRLAKRHNIPARIKPLEPGHTTARKLNTKT